MKGLTFNLFVLITVLFGCCERVRSHESLSKEINPICARGQSYWCRNITTATSCNALKHCIQAVWEKEVPIEVDRSEVCQTCLDMVKQARDQLMSNQTQEEIKAVLEGSCRLIPIKIVSEECIKLMDEFAPQLIDTLASQMNPQVVCSVAGLCNNNRVHQLEAEYNNMKGESKMNCQSCHGIMYLARENFNNMVPDEFLNILMKVCGRAGSYSDGCFDIAVRNHEKMLTWLQDKLMPRPVCNLVNLCPPKTSSDPESFEMSLYQQRGDLPCDLCVQLVQHLRDILISNTTESDFKLMLQGICSQMKAYKDQCLEMVDKYYEFAYTFLVNELDGQLICKEIKLCPQTNEKQEIVRPLQLSGESGVSNKAPVQLPLTRFNPITLVPYSFVPQSNANDQTLCTMCEYFLHFIQQEITLPSTEKKIRDLVMKGCDKAPSSIRQECDDFVNTYMDNLVALLAQAIDPSQICPKLGVCPGGLIAVAYKDKPSCPLCLLAFQEIITKVKNTNRTSKIIGDVVDDLCIRDEFPSSISMECVQFITHYKDSIVDMVLTEFTPQESCAFIDLCVPHEMVEHISAAGDIKTNEIIQNPDIESSSSCVLCEFIMSKIEELLKDRTTEEEIREMVYKVCNYMPSTVTPKCQKFVNQYADLLIELLAQEIDPKQVCTAINLCAPASSLIKGPLERCLLCEVLMDSLRTVLTDPQIDDDLNRQLEHACRMVPPRERNLCLNLIDQLAPQIEMALRTIPVGPLVCRRIHLCEERREPVNLGTKGCRFGSSYWCSSSTNAAQCNAIEYCQKEVWKSNKPRKSHNKGQVVISY